MEYEIGDLVLLQAGKAGNWTLKGIVVDEAEDELGEKYEIYCFAGKCNRFFYKKDLKLLNNYKHGTSNN
tara:strand:- start:170 stop:376 length:207 start_codon:yes stop_codon:yes gene_type:complete